MSSVHTVVSFYKFVVLNDCGELKKSLKSLCLDLKLSGTIILAAEGVNGMLAGSAEAINALIEHFKADSRFADILFKLSEHQGTTFRRMLVKVKKQCLTFRSEADPTQQTGKRLEPLELKRWLDEGKDILLLDTRNDYEFKAGSFKNAIDPCLKSFDEFSTWVDTNLHDAKDRPIVTFCTGGIRCEKATAYMLKQGFSDVYQLDGGIITYLEQTQNASDDNHWLGECIVFDKRYAVDKQLRPSSKQHCFVCLSQLDGKTSAAEEFPAGVACAPCAAAMHQHQERRNSSGLQRHQDNIRRRREFIAAQRANVRGAASSEL